MKKLLASEMISALESLIEEYGDQKVDITFAEIPENEIINHSVEYSLSLEDVQDDSGKVIYLWIYPIIE
ncbi:MAG: hypothetical protein ACXAAT_17995 [Candidatus Hodarchaeales archaeon]|jgi:hypothetical protein